MADTKSEQFTAKQLSEQLKKTYKVKLVERRDEIKAAFKPEATVEGPWPLKETQIVFDGLREVINAMGGQELFERFFGDLALRRGTITYRAQADHTGILFTTADISIDGWTIAHEMGHVWDSRYNWRISQALEKYTGGNTNQLLAAAKQRLGRCDADGRFPGCNNAGYFYEGPPPAGSDRNFTRLEDFAEAFAAFVYPKIAQSRVAVYRNNPTYQSLLFYEDYTKTKRWAFVNGLLHGTLITDYRLTPR